MRSALLRCLIVGTLVLFGLAGPASAGGAQPPPVTATRTTLTAPDAAATDFGRGFAMDDQRVVASADLGAGRVVYVFDRQPDGSWTHSATIPAPATASDQWGNFLAVAGGFLAVADPGFVRGTENYGRVHVQRLGAGGWAQVQVLQVPGEFRSFGTGVWMTGDALLVRDAGYCDSSCSWGRTLLYERGLIAPFGLRSDSGFLRPSLGLTVGVDVGRIVTGVPGFVDFFGSPDPFDNVLSVWDATPQPAVLRYNEVRPFGLDPAASSFDDPFHNVDISGGALAYESCCQETQELVLLRATATGFAQEQAVPITSPADALAMVPGVVLRADRAAGVLHTVVRGPGGWTPSSDLALPADTEPHRSLPFLTAAGSRVLVKGTGTLHVLEVAVAGPGCLGQPATVVVADGGTPTDGADVIVGTPDNDVVDARDGDDVVCAGAGDDLVHGGGGNNILAGESGVDVLAGGPGGDIISGGDDGDWTGGGDGGDLLIGGPGNDWELGGDGNDIVLSLDGDDRVLGEAGDDLLHAAPGLDTVDGGPGTDRCVGTTVVACEG